MQKPKVPSYINLMSELVATLETMMTYPLPPEVEESIVKRCKELKLIEADDIHLNDIKKDFPLRFKIKN